MTALVLCAVLMLAVVLGVRPIARSLQRRWPGSTEPAELTAAEESRLQAIADVPLVDLIEAAERRATHPDEPLPKILADLDPETRVQDTAPAPVVGVEVMPSLGGFLNEYGKLRPSGLLVLPPGMNCEVVPIRPPAQPAPKRKPVPDPYADCDHEEADRAEIHSFDSATPIKSIVTACPRCDVAESAQAEPWPGQWRTQFQP
jgi:hypothetical protein